VIFQHSTFKLPLLRDIKNFQFSDYSYMSRDKRSKIEEKVLGIVIIVMVVAGITISFSGNSLRAVDPQTQPVTSQPLKLTNNVAG